MPEFRFDVWVAGLAVLTPLVDRGLRSARAATIVFAGLMALNGVAHLTVTIAGRTIAAVEFESPMPGSWSSPLLIGAEVLFIVRARDRDGVTE